MKKLLLSLLFISSFSIYQSQAQSEGFELGARLASGDGRVFGALDAIFTLSENNRVQADLSLDDDYIGLAASYQWQFLIQNNFSWYIGPGAYLGINDNSTPFKVEAVGGIEYHFGEAPIALGLDVRPGFFIIDSGQDFESNFGFMIRYVFP